MSSTSASARLILSYAGTGKLDALLTAIPLLKKRIAVHRMMKMRRGHPNPNPTPVELMKTHFLPVVDLFKPHIIAALEYHRQNATSGGGAFGRESVYDIPLAGDLFSDCLMEVQFPEVRCANATFSTAAPPSLIVLPKGYVPAAGTAFQPTVLSGTGVNSVFSLAVGVAPTLPYNTSNNSFKAFNVTADTGILPNKQPYTAGGNYNLSRNYRFVNGAGAIVMGADGSNPDGTTSTTLANWVRMVDWPGLRMYDKVTFDVNNTVIDDYDEICAVRHMQHTVPPHKMRAFQALVGHQTSPQQAISDRVSAAGSSVLSTVGQSNIEASVKQRTAIAGYQVPQPAIQAHIFHPLLFWFCLSKRSAIPGVCMPDGQKHIRAAMTNLRNLFVPASPDLFVEETAYFTPTVAGAAPHFKVVNKYPVIVPGSELAAAADDVTSYLHVCHIFMDQDIHDIFISRISFMLVRLHKYIANNIQSANGNNRISSTIKFPVEYLHIGFRESVLGKCGVSSTAAPQNDGSAIANHYRAASGDKSADYASLWHRSGLNRLEQVPELKTTRFLFVDAAGDPLPGAAGAVGVDPVYVNMFGASNLSEANAGFGPAVAGSYVSLVEQTDCFTHVSNRPLIGEIEIQAQGQSMWANYAQQIYNRYMTYQYGADAINGTDEESQFFVTWALYPGMFQPSGFLNFSRLREIDLIHKNSTGKHIGPGAEETVNQVSCHVLASSLNFLLIADGNALIRYV